MSQKPKISKFEGLELSEDLALWTLRRKVGISDNNQNGWKVLALAMTRQYLPEALELSNIDSLAAALLGIPDASKARGRKVKWTDKRMGMLLTAIDRKKAVSKNPSETDQSALAKLFPDGIPEHNISFKTLLNRVSLARKKDKIKPLPRPIPKNKP